MEIAREEGRFPRCNECGMPELTERNQVIWWLLKECGMGLLDSYGAVNVQNVHAVFEINEIPKHERPWMLRQIMAFCQERYGKQDSP